MNTKWTDSQLRAINERGGEGSILVSAAAGSGKTAVLIERILKIIKEKTDVDKLLIVTFSAAAAAEMKDRLYASLQKELDSENITNAQIRRLVRQQTLLSKAHITTIHSFCQSVVKSNPAESGIDASFRIADSEGEIAMERADVMDEVLERWYAKNDAGFARLVEIYGSYKSDKGLEEQIFSLYDFARNSPNTEKWLSDQKKAFDPAMCTDFGNTKWCAEIVKSIYVTTEAYFDNIIRLRDKSIKAGLYEMEITLTRDMNVLKNVFDTFKAFYGRITDGGTCSWEEIYDACAAVSFQRAESVSKKRLAEYPQDVQILCDSIKDERKKIIDKTKKYLSDITGGSKAAPYDDLEVLYGDISCLIDVTLDFAESFAASKYEKHILDFEDLEHIAYKTLSDENGAPNAAAARYASYFEEIYIDEYQDTNEIQEAVLSLVSRNRRNIFMVGDVKQCIYEFRQARPDLFMEKYRSFLKDKEPGKLIILNSNFRSRTGVVNSVNRVFRGIMTEKTCDFPYTQNEQLNFGAAFYPEEGTLNDRETEMYIIENTPAKTKSDRNFEAEAVAGIIRNLIDSKYQIYDKHTGGMRDIRYGDIVVLMRSPGKMGDEYADAMQQAGISARYDASKGGFFSNAEINIMLSFMKIIDNPVQDIHFVSAMRNVYGFTDSQIALIKADSLKRGVQDESFYAMCLNYSGMPEQDGNLKEKLLRFITRLEELREMSRRMSVSELLWVLMHENHFCDNLSRGPLGALHRANINILYAKAVKYDAGTDKGLFRFLYYYDVMKKRRGDMREASPMADSSDVVHIMSIHKSKGLEFPVVILAQTASSFSRRDNEDPLLKHRVLGLGPICYREDTHVKYPSIMRMTAERRIAADKKNEEMRLLYVAMTRAAEKLIITGSISTSFDNYSQKCNNMKSPVTKEPIGCSVLEAGCMLDWLMMSEAAEPGSIHVLDICGRNEEEDSVNENMQRSLPVPAPPMTFYTLSQRASENRLPAKISITELKRRLSDNESPEASPYKAYSPADFAEIPDLSAKGENNKKALTAAQKGTAFHLCLSLTDYGRIKNISGSEASDYAGELVLYAGDAGYLSREEAESVDTELLADYFTSSIAKKIAEADEVLKEVPFTQIAEIEGNRISVQGIIDCLIKKDGEYTVIDFKTDEYPSVEKYRTQLSYYAQCVKRYFGKDPEKIVYFVKSGKEVHL